MALVNAEDPASGPGPWFIAAHDGRCSCCGHDIVEGDEIRADGHGSWEGRECCGGDDEIGAWALRPGAHEHHFDGSSFEEMGL